MLEHRRPVAGNRLAEYQPVRIEQRSPALLAAQHEEIAASLRPEDNRFAVDRARLARTARINNTALPSSRLTSKKLARYGSYE
jgi:hypothetical protein